MNWPFDFGWSRRERLLVVGALVAVLLLLAYVYGPLLLGLSPLDIGGEAVTVENDRDLTLVAKAVLLQGVVDNYTVTYVDGRTETVSMAGDSLPMWFDSGRVHDVDPAGGFELAASNLTVGPGERRVLIERTPHAPGTTALVVVRTPGPDRHVVASVARRCWPGFVDDAEIEVGPDGDSTGTDCEIPEEWVPLTAAEQPRAE